MKRIAHPKDFCAGALFLAFGLAAVVLGRRYTFGTTASMGPGFFPTILGGLLAALGLLAIARSLRRKGRGGALGALGLRPLASVLGSVVVFAVALPGLGLVVSSMLLVAVSRTASHDFSWAEVLLFGAVMTAFCALVFIGGLQLPMALWPRFIGG